MKGHLIIGLGLLFCLSGSAAAMDFVSAQRILCKHDVSRACKKDGCMQIHKNDERFTVIDVEAKTISQCGKDDGCSPFTIDEKWTSGIFLLFRVGSSITKIALIDADTFGIKEGDLMNNRSSMDFIISDWGSCVAEK